MVTNKQSTRKRKLVSWLLTLAMVVSLFAGMSEAVSADDNDTKLTIKYGEDVNTITVGMWNSQEKTTALYSKLNGMGVFVPAAEYSGVEIDTLLNAALSEDEMIAVATNDYDISLGNKTIKYSELFADRYCFNKDGDNFIQGAKVEPIITDNGDVLIGMKTSSDANQSYCVNAINTVSVIIPASGGGDEPSSVTPDKSWYVGHESDASFVLEDEADLVGLAEIVNSGVEFTDKTISLKNSIALTQVWTPIGDKDHAFKGTFNGAGFAITGLNITSAAGGYKGFFGNNGGTVKNFSISGSIGASSTPITSGADNIGGAVGYNGGTVSNITGNVTIYVNSGSIYAIGGIVGQNGDGGMVKECINNANITGTKAVGGIVGRNYEDINKCCNKGNITGNGGSKDGIGGIVGIAGNKNGTYANSVTNCYNTGATENPNGRWYGGIAGMADSAATITHCYSTGTVASGYSWNWNPIMGHVDAYYSTVHDNYSLEGLNHGDTNSSTLPNTVGTVKTATELKAADMINLLGTAYAMDTESINSGYPILRWQASSTAVSETTTITKGGVYNIGESTTGTITISTTELVTLVGPGTDKQLNNLTFEYSVAGANLRIEGFNISKPDSGSGTDKNIINFVGTGNKLAIEGESIINYEPSNYATSMAAIHVPANGDLAINGAGKLYLYKTSAGAAIGGDNNEANGKITINSGKLFVKGTKQGAVIGSGSGSKTVGDIIINGGELYCIGNARGAILGGAATSGGASDAGNVYINGGTITFNVDFSGAAIGGGGFDTGNDAVGGKLYIAGGSVKTVIDENAKSSWGVETAGVNDKAITAIKLNNTTDNKAVSLLQFDTAKIMRASGAADPATITIQEGTNKIYEGGLHKYKFVNSDKIKAEQVAIPSTPDNWVADTDSKVYIYLTQENHTLIVNNQSFKVKWDSQTSAFSYEWAGDNVISLINAIGAVDATNACKDKIEAAEAAYSALSSSDKAFVSNYSVLTDARNGYEAKVVDGQIDAIGTVTLAKKSDIEAARSAYNGLSSVRKTLVTKLTILESAEARLTALEADKTAADDVITKINDIGIVTLESKAKIDIARAAYDGLDEDGESFVSAAELKVLTDAEASYKTLKDAADKEAADKAAAKAVTNLVKAISSQVTLADKTAVENAKTAYDALTDDQKLLVESGDKTTLDDAVNAMETLMQPIEAVEAKVDKIPATSGLTGSDDDMKAIMDAQKAYDDLDATEKSLVSSAEKAKLEAAKNKVAELNHKSGGVIIEGLPWNVKVVAEPKTSGEDFDAMKKSGNGKTLLAMYDISLSQFDSEDETWGEYNVEEGLVDVTIINNAFAGYYRAVAIHQLDEEGADGNPKYENVPATINGNAASFKASGFSSYGIAGEKMPDAASKTGDNFNLIPILIIMLIAAAGAAGAFVVRRKKLQ